ncbi:MAG: hypothetical protein US69_C0002G0042 [candidate division TM6 bacterium GW2011_GWF2_38_10]|nr:MAG: hypothetical protein US69_C0002G0042 [candidate division TM6 bacterium GW2011_GWF2_38_10]
MHLIGAAIIAGIAQLARATAFQAVGCGFEPRFPLQLKEKCAGIAQLVEQLICNQQVAGSSPVASSIKIHLEIQVIFLCFFFSNLARSLY